MPNDYLMIMFIIGAVVLTALILIPIEGTRQHLRDNKTSGRRSLVFKKGILRVELYYYSIEEKNDIISYMSRSGFYLEE